MPDNCFVNIRQSGVGFILTSGGIRKAGTGASTGAKNVRWTVSYAAGESIGYDPRARSSVTRMEIRLFHTPFT